VYHAVDKAAKKIRKNPKPILIEAMTFRMRGHEEASGTKYVPQELFDQWAKKDPVDRYEEFLLKEKIISQAEVDNLRAEIKANINEGLKTAGQDVYPEVNTEQQVADLFLQSDSKPIAPKSEKKSSKRYVDAISDGLKQSFEKYPELVIMGQDVADYGGVFKITEGFIDKFGKDRIRNTPLCESAIIGIGLGMSIKKQKSVIEMQFADFVTCGFNQIINNLAKSHYRWGQNADVVVRMPTGAGVAEPTLLRPPPPNTVDLAQGQNFHPPQPTAQLHSAPQDVPLLPVTPSPLSPACRPSQPCSQTWVGEVCVQEEDWWAALANAAPPSSARGALAAVMRPPSR
jgi:2-oxoisovalerate dehydrogenase E1 component